MRDRRDVPQFPILLAKTRERSVCPPVSVPRFQIEILPVVNRADVHKLEGILTLRDVLDSYGVSARDRA